MPEHNLIEEIADLVGLKTHVKGCQLPFKDAHIDYYRALGERLGFTVVKSPQVIVSGFDFGKLDLAWVEPDIVFFSEYALLEDIYPHLYKVMVLKPAHCVILASSNSKCKPEKIRRLIDATAQLNDTNFTIVDVAGD